MVARSRIIIDTDPGTDDVLAHLLAFSAKPEEIEILLVSVTFGNVDVQLCLRNVVSMFHVIEKEIKWRREQGLPEGFEALKSCKPIVAVGAEEPLGDPREIAAYYHGIDGLGGVHTTHPHHSCPEETWKTLFDRPPPDNLVTNSALSATHTSDRLPKLFTPSNRPSHLEILRILGENPPNTITIIAIGPLTNLALAASHSHATFLRAKQVLIMGGAVHGPGNVTPAAEFNTLADPTAAARVFALTSPRPESTMPPTIPQPLSDNSTETGDGKPERIILPPYPPAEKFFPSALGSSQGRLKIILFPLDITGLHTIRRDEFTLATASRLQAGSPLAEWVTGFMNPTFLTMETLHHGHSGGATALELHDPLTVWYALTFDQSDDGSASQQQQQQQQLWRISEGEDIRVETVGQWTKGMIVVDRRTRKKGGETEEEVVGDKGGWLSKMKGNRVGRCVGTPGERELARFWLERVFGGDGYVAS